MYLEAGLFERSKPGVYIWKEPLMITSTIAKKIYHESFKVNKSITEIRDYQLMDPYFVFIE